MKFSKQYSFMKGKNMVQFMQIITANASAFLLLLILKTQMNTQTKHSPLLDIKIFSMMINLTMFQCVFDTLVFWIDGRMFPMSRELNYIGNVIYYILNMSISYLWPLFTEYKMNQNTAKLKKLAVALGIPLVLFAVLVASTPFTDFIFTITPDNLYARTSWRFFIPTFLITFYTLYGTFRIHMHRKNTGKYMLFPAIVFVSPLLLAIIVQTLSYGVSLIFIGIAIGLTGVYFSTLSESTYIDQLCEVYNRRYYNVYISTLCNSKNSGIITGALIDMDDFKLINDRFGHDIGDEALIQFASILKKHMQKVGVVVRYGGDEFILLAKCSVAEMDAAIDAIEKEIRDTNASGRNRFHMAFSYGITEITQGSCPEDFLRTSDKRMYAMKNERKAGR